MNVYVVYLYCEESEAEMKIYFQGEFPPTEERVKELIEEKIRTRTYNQRMWDGLSLTYIVEEPVHLHKC
jgi:hypothetical protein